MATEHETLEEVVADECWACGHREFKTETVTQQLGYGQEGETFEATFEAHMCTNCGEGFTDWKAEEARTLAMFKFEKTKGIVRTHFCNDDERKLWEAA